MTPKQIAHARRKLALVGRTRASVPYLYCAAAEDGLPLLMVEEARLDARAVSQTLRRAKRKVFVRGRVERAEDGSLRFLVDTEQIQDFMTDLRGVLNDDIPGLQHAIIAPLSDEA